MAGRTKSPAELGDRSYWRRLKATCHPDAGGDHELFLWIVALEEYVHANLTGFGREAPYSAGQSRRADSEQPDRIPFDPHECGDHLALNLRALGIADEVEEPYASLLRLLVDCGAGWSGREQVLERRGATWRSVAAIAHEAGLSYEQRQRWYRIAEYVPLSQKMAGHILSRLKEEAA